MRSSAGSEFSSGSRGRHRSLVGADGRHGLVAVRDGHDTAAEGNAFSGKAVGVSGAVVFLVVLSDAVSPGSQPPAEWCGETRACQRVALEKQPLDVIGFAGFVENRSGNGEFADVMEKSGPSESVAVALG